MSIDNQLTRLEGANRKPVRTGDAAVTEPPLSASGGPRAATAAVDIAVAARAGRSWSVVLTPG